jgi:cutinase
VRLLPRIRGRKIATFAAAVAILSGGGVVLTAGPSSAATCTDINVVSARGTFESAGLGAIVGQPVYNALKAQITGKSFSSYAVDYPASLGAGSPSKGNTDLVDHVKSQAAACPNQKFILIGYSQGANVVDNSIGISSNGALVGGAITETIPAADASKVAALLLFGNPIRAIGKSVTGAYASRTLDTCASGDPICGAGINILAHLSYGSDAKTAAQFAATKV